jgi:hypothetical protein
MTDAADTTATTVNNTAAAAAVTTAAVIAAAAAAAAVTADASATLLLLKAGLQYVIQLLCIIILEPHRRCRQRGSPSVLQRTFCEAFLL